MIDLIALYLKVSSEDRLPKIVCTMCIKRLENIHRFVTLSHRAQDKLKVQYYGRDNGDIKQINDNDDDKGDKRLLRSILNKVILSYCCIIYYYYCQ